MRRAYAFWRRIAIAAACAAGCDPIDDETRPLDDLLPVPDTNPDPMGAPTLGAITPVLFVPSDRAIEQRHIDAVNGGLGDLRAWYESRLGTHRLEMLDLQIVQGSLTAAEYRENDGIWNLGPDELKAKLGYSPWDEGHLVLVIGAGLRGWAGGGSPPEGTSGFAGLGLESLTDPTDCEPGKTAGEGDLWWCTPTVWRGTAIHELGHALTLPHSEAPSIMDNHTDYTNRVLLGSEGAKVAAGIFVRPLQGGDPSGGDPSGGDPSGGDPPANNDWQACGSDGDCTSGWCGCNGGSDLVCLPNAEYSKDCAGWKDEWTACGSDAECKSLWCGCNGGTENVCLPSTDYSKDCGVPPKNDWEPCSADAECISQWCGCNFGSDVVCLPNAEYPKDCV